jgi:hypothetical protein
MTRLHDRRDGHPRRAHRLGKAETFAEHELAQPAVVELLQRVTHLALLGPEALQCLVAEVVGRPLPNSWSNWSHGEAEEPNSRSALGLLPQQVWTVPARDNRVRVAADEQGQVLLTFELERPEATDPPAAGATARQGAPGQPPAEITLYADPDGPRGPEVLDALATLASGVWPTPIAFAHAPAEMYPRRGTGPAWTGTGAGRTWPGPVDWSPLVLHPFSERFLRLPREAVLGQADASGRATVAIALGHKFASQAARLLRDRLFLNHTVLCNRVVERIEPDGSLEDEEPFRLRGAAPVVLECVDIDRGRQYFDQRFCLPGTDPARLFALDRCGEEAACCLRFLGEPVPRRRLRVAYLRPLDWDRLAIEPGETTFEVNRTPRFRARTAVAPEPDTACHRTQSRQALLCWWRDLGLGTEPRWPSEADLIRLTRRLLPAPLRAWVDDAPTEERPLGFRLDLEARRRGPTAYMTRVIRLRPRAGAPRAQLAGYLSWLGRALEHRCGGGLFVNVEWEGSVDE